MKIRDLTKVSLFVGVFLFATVFGIAQNTKVSKSKALMKNNLVLTPKAKLVQAYENIKKEKQFSFFEKRTTNGDTFETKFDYTFPNSYRLDSYKVQKGKEIKNDYISIGKRLYTKQDGKWFEEKEEVMKEIMIFALLTNREINPFDVESKGSRDNSGFEVEELESELLSEEKIEVLKYVLGAGLVPMQGKVWIKNGLPVKHSFESTLNSINKINGETIYDYVVRVKITKPL